jgi:quercetin dioxygenase-like cupin family protein
MKKLIITAIVALAGFNNVNAQEIGIATFAAGQVQRVVYADNTAWKACPPSLPKNCEIAVFEGHPKKPDLFTVRFHSPDDMHMPAHTHPKDERVTILKGKVAVAFGVNAKREDAKEFGPGDFYINKRDEVHKVWMDKGAVLQITGIGPWKADFVEKHYTE